MPILLRHHEEIELNRVEYSGSVTREELFALAAFFVKETNWLGFDCLNLITPSTDFDTVPLNELDGVYAQYMAMFAPLHFHISRRSAWICQSEAACAHIPVASCAITARSRCSSPAAYASTSTPWTRSIEMYQRPPCSKSS